MVLRHLQFALLATVFVWRQGEFVEVEYQFVLLSIALTVLHKKNTFYRLRHILYFYFLQSWRFLRLEANRNTKKRPEYEGSGRFFCGIVGRRRCLQITTLRYLQFALLVTVFVWQQRKDSPCMSKNARRVDGVM